MPTGIMTEDAKALKASMDDRDEVLGLVNRMLTANRGDRSEVMRSLVHETEAQMDNFPDGRIGFTEMHEAGIRLEHMYPLEKTGQ